METLDEVRDLWDAAARKDAMGYILTTGQQWDHHAFFDHGQIEIDEALAYLDERGLRGNRRDRALDFGCGVGRLTQALAEHYDVVDGVDIAPSMITQARAHNRRNGKVIYRVRRSLDSYWDGTFDLVYSNLVLQHMPQRFAFGYIAEFIRVLHHDGLAVFELPEGPDLPHGDRCLSMFATPKERVAEVVQTAGGEVMDVELIYEPSTWRCYRYTARRA